MESVILVIIMVCGQIDTVLIKQPNKGAIYTRDLSNPRIDKELGVILKQKPVVIKYEDDRGICV